MKEGDIVKIKSELKTQRWYVPDYMVVSKVNHHRKLYNFGTDTEFIRLGSGLKISLFDSYVEKVPIDVEREIKIQLILGD